MKSTTVFTVLIMLLVLSCGCASVKGRADSVVFRQGAFKKAGADTFDCVLYHFEPNVHTWFLIIYSEHTDTWSADKVLFTLKGFRTSTRMLYTLSEFLWERRGRWSGGNSRLVDYSLDCHLDRGHLKGRIEGRMKEESSDKAPIKPFTIEFTLPEDAAEYDRLKELEQRDSW